MSVRMSVNMGMYINEQLLNNMSKVSQELAIKVVRECGEKYGFDSETAIRELGLESIVSIVVSRKKSSKSSKELKSKVVVSKEKARFALPFNGECDDSCCQALRQNNGLYTQCQMVRKGENVYCKSCSQLASKSVDGVPEYGTIMQRMSVGIFEYIDPKGRKPVSYTKVMKKYKLTEEQVLAEAGRLNITINPGHLVTGSEEPKRGRPASPKEPKEPKGSKGRPKKAKKVLEIEGDEEDLFASLVADATQEEEIEVEEEVEVVKVDTKALEKKQKEEQRLKEKAEKEAKLAAEKADKEAKLAAEKAEKEAKLAAKELEKKQKEEQRLKEKAEKEAKLAAEKAEKEAKLAADKAEKEAKLAAEKEAKLAEKKDVKKKKAPESPKKAAVEAEEDEPDVVKKIEFEGKKYLKSKKTGIIYDYTEYVKNGDQLVVGKWNDSKNKIDFTETSEESEEEYEE